MEALSAKLVGLDVPENIPMTNGAFEGMFSTRPRIGQNW
jgi:hypothetical protein